VSPVRWLRAFAVVGATALLLASSCSWQLGPYIPKGVPPPPGLPVPQVDTHAKGRPAEQLREWAGALAPSLRIPVTALEAYAYAARVAEVENPSCHIAWTTLAGIGAQPTAERRTFGIDLRYDWPTALRAAGLDTEAPTAWLAEGLLIYLPPEAQDRLFDNITAMSAAGSTIATEYVPGLRDLDPERVRERTAAFREHIDIDMPSLVYTGERSHVVEYLRSKGWDAVGTPRAELYNRDGLELPDPEDDEPLGEIIYVSGTLAG